MNKSILIVVLVLVGLGAAWWFARDTTVQKSEGAQPAAVEKPSGVPNANNPQPTLPVDDSSKREVPSTPPAATNESSKTANAARNGRVAEKNPLADLEAKWKASYATANKADTAAAIEKFGALAREQRDGLFAQYSNGRAQTVFDNETSDAATLERRLTTPGNYAAAQLVTAGRGTTPSEFRVVYLTAEEAPELAATERVIDFLNDHAKTAGD